MTLHHSTSNQRTPAKSFTVARHAEPAQPLNSSVDETSCDVHLNRLIKEIDSPKVREIVGAVFGDLLRLLEHLRPIEAQLHKVDEADDTLALFQFIHDEASALVIFINEDALNCKALNHELCETLDGIAFAVSHDLQRVFEGQLPELTADMSREVVGKLFRAHDLLTNCLQQATISLATMFDSELVGTKLFSNSDMSYRKSVQLCEELATLLKLVEASVDIPGEPAFANLTAGVQKFRDESIECLRYSDSPQFESFCERIELAITPAQLEPVLHQFRCYLETLLGQVKMRAVLANVSPIELGEDDSQQLTSPAPNSSSQFYLPTEFQDDRVAWDPFAKAV